MEARAQKRKLVTRQSSRKKMKYRAESKAAELSTTAVDDLPWKTVPSKDVTDFGDGMLMLEEVEDVEVVYKEGSDGHRITQFRIKEHPVSEEAVADLGDTPKYSSPVSIDPFDTTLLPSWAPFPLHPALLHSIHHRGFESPTEIQRRTLQAFLNVPPSDAKEDVGAADRGKQEPRDIIGISETGSGKTLAYGLPILHTILNSPFLPSSASLRPLRALVLAPTRELALQVSDHLNSCLNQLFAIQKKNGEPPTISVAAIVGGMSVQKQRRILSRGVDVLVATPGRFWDLCGEDPTLASQLRSIQFLVLDEADRMIEAGHFQELDNILRITSRPPLDTGDATVEDTRRPEDLAYADIQVHERNDDMQTFVFSATMSKELQRDLKRRKRNRKDGDGTTLDELLMRLDFRDPDPVIIDLSPEGGRVQSLQESKTECLTSDKDAYLYYFLLRHPGRSLVFLSSIDGIRRLMPLLELLRLSVWPLHSGLQQKQRLKNLDRFKSTPNSVLLATDVAARGLDVPAVDHVIHYQVPRSADAYVHRNGRTARAMRKGFALVLCAPDERRVFRGVLTGLGRDEDDIPELKVEYYLVDKLKQRVQLARQIDGMAHRSKKVVHERNWMRDTAEAMDLEIPSELESDGSDGGFRKSAEDGKLKALKARLKDELAQPLVARGVSTRYITSGSRRVVDDVLEGESHEILLGLKRVQAGSEVVKSKKRTKRPRQKVI